MSPLLHPLALIICLSLPFLQPSTEASSSRRSCSSRRTHKTGSRCERLNRFLQDVLMARDDLSWIDQVADQLRSKNLFITSPALQDKINAMFFTSSKSLWSPLRGKTPNGIHARRKRHSRPTLGSPRLKLESERLQRRGADASPAKEDFNSREAGYENASSSSSAALQREQNFNSATRRPERAITARWNTNAIATPATADPLEKVLQSINVFPVEAAADPYAPAETVASIGESGPRLKSSGDDSAKSDAATRVARLGVITSPAASEAASDDAAEARTPRVGRALKSISLVNGDPIDNKFTKLLSTDNKDDKSLMIRALHGDLAKEIVNAIFDQMKNKGGVNKMTNYEQHYNIKPLDSIIIENMYRRELDSEADNGTANITKRLMELVQQLISDEIEKKACAALPPDLQDFLQRLLEIEVTQNYDDKNTEVLKVKKEQLMTNNNSDNSSISNLDEWYRKEETLKSLLNKYEGLSKKEKNKVRAIHEYLVTRLEFVEAYIEAFKSYPMPQDKFINIHIN